MIKSFFLIDDDKDDTEFFADALKDIDSSIEFNYSLNCRELLTTLIQNRPKPHIIFLDINMPGISGWECLQRLKNNIYTRDIPVIMYSTSSAMFEGKKAVSSGAVGFYEKPANFGWLREFLTAISATPASDLRKTLRELRQTNYHRIYVE
jgi:CheY-like chemotaxis protein